MVPKVEVRFEDLLITADVQTGSRALPTLVNYTLNIAEVRKLYAQFSFVSIGYDYLFNILCMFAFVSNRLF